jgi:hypothetical protein
MLVARTVRMDMADSHDLVRLQSSQSPYLPNAHMRISELYA